MTPWTTGTRRRWSTSFVVDAGSAPEYQSVFNQAVSVITVDNDGVQEEDPGDGNGDDEGQGQEGGERPGWGCGDRNHEHTGPAGNDSESPCKDREEGSNSGQDIGPAGSGGDDKPGVGHGRSGRGAEFSGQGAAKGHGPDGNPGKGKGRG